MYADILALSELYELLLRMDRGLAEQARQSGCEYCGGPLHSANYRRRPRGIPDELQLDPEFELCFSLCCSIEGCRRRHLAPSVRFLGRRVYIGVVVLLVAAMRQGPTPRTVRRLQMLVGADRRTIERWCRWWKESLPRTTSWRRGRGHFDRPVEEVRLPQSLIERFREPMLDRVVGTLKFLSLLGHGI